MFNVEVTARLWPVDSWPRISEAVERGRTCLERGECETRCPYELSIRGLLADGIAAYERIAADR